MGEFEAGSGEMEQKNGPKRVLVVVGRMHYGGIESMLMNLMRNMDRDKVIFDFMVNYQEPGAYDEEIRAMGGKIYLVPRLFLKNTFRYIKALNEFFAAHKGEYEIIHGHLPSAAVLYLNIARRHGVKTCILHAHSTSIRRRWKQYVERPLVLMARGSADYYFACSDAAGAYCFGKKRLSKPNYVLFQNGIMVDRFLFRRPLRESARQSEGLGDKFVVGHVGRFVEPKNHTQLVEIFAEVAKLRRDAVLLLIGDGPLMEACQRQVAVLGLEERVRFLGMRGDMDALYMAMDAFVLPSLYEGLPVAAIEAQAAGLPCFFSDTVTKNVDATGLCHYLSLHDSAAQWARTIVTQTDGFERKCQKDAIANAGYDAAKQAKWLEDFYLSL